MTPLQDVQALYCDGGLIGPRNPSPYGGTWSWRAVGPTDLLLGSGSGIIPAPIGGTVGNNWAELHAAVSALEAVPPDWRGFLYSDSQITLGRLGRLPGQEMGWALNKVPDALRHRLQQVLRSHPHFHGCLLQGHPTAQELVAGRGRKGRPVSAHNVLCDQECRRRAVEYLEGIHA